MGRVMLRQGVGAMQIGMRACKEGAERAQYGRVGR